MSVPNRITHAWIVGALLLIQPGCISRSQHESILAKAVQAERETAERNMEAAVAHTKDLVTAELESRHAKVMQTLHAKFEAEKEAIATTNKREREALEKRHEIEVKRLKDEHVAELAAARQAARDEVEKQRAIAAKKLDGLQEQHRHEIETVAAEKLREGWSTATVLNALEQSAVLVGLMFIGILAAFIAIDRRSKVAFRKYTQETT